ncbi:MAG TPA: hypothetical protein PKC79_12455 [Solidesulfovibrio magneticus]|nr:hypothetical protein [Solidesulfovibrio magneticus]
MISHQIIQLLRIIADLDAGIAPKPVRRTTLTRREDGSFLRSVLADDGSVVAEEIVTPGQSVGLHNPEILRDIAAP